MNASAKILRENAVKVAGYQPEIIVKISSLKNMLLCIQTEEAKGESTVNWCYVCRNSAEDLFSIHGNVVSNRI